MIPISVFIITKNEADRIQKVIDSAKKFADEIIVVDSFSTDNTVDIAKKLGAKVEQKKFEGYGQQKIFAENLCKNLWILNIDADEEISSELANEIKEVFSKEINQNIAGFKIKIVNKFRFETKPKKLAYFYNQFRLYRKDIAGFKNSSVHDSVELKTNKDFQIEQFKNIIFHQSFRSYSHWLDKVNSYSTMQAIDSFNKHENPCWAKVFVSPILAFFKAYFIRRYWIYGLNGLVYSLIFAFSRFAKAIKTKELFTASITEKNE